VLGEETAVERERELRERLAAYLERSGVLRNPAVASAVRAVPRHRFLPHLSLEDAYADRAVAIKESEGVVISSISQPGMIVQMLDLLAVEPGSRVLEIGTGSGYNAALLAELTGPTGTVISVDIEVDLVEHARALLHDLGYTWADAVVADGRAPVNGSGFDRIIATARATDVEAAWWDELRDGGRIVVPLDIGFGGERAIGFVREGPRLRAIGSHPCAFIALRSEVSTAGGQLFFRDPAMRYATPPSARQPLQIIAVRPKDADETLLQTSDAVVARPTTLFAVTAAS